MNANNIKKSLAAFFAASVLTVSSTFASSCGTSVCDPCADPCGSCCDEFSAEIDFLYWKACKNDMDYAISWDSDVTDLTTPAVGRYKYVEHCYEPGVRAKVAFGDCFCGWGMQASYTWLESNESTKATQDANGELFSTLAFPYGAAVAGINSTNSDEIRARHRICYQTFDVLLTNEVCLNQCHNFMPFFGVTGLFLDQEIRSTFITAEATQADTTIVKGESDYWGVGLKIGTEYNFALNDCLGFYASGSAMVVAGEQSDTLKQTGTINSAATDFDVQVKDDQCVFVPGYHIGLGFKYNQCWCNNVFTALVGWEFVDWFNVGTPRRFFNNSGVAAIDGAAANTVGRSTSGTGANLGYQGLVIGLSMEF